MCLECLGEVKAIICESSASIADDGRGSGTYALVVWDELVLFLAWLLALLLAFSFDQTNWLVVARVFVLFYRLYHVVVLYADLFYFDVVVP